MQLRPSLFGAVGRIHHVGGSGDARGSPISPRQRIELTRSHGFLPGRDRPLAELS